MGFSIAFYLEWWNPWKRSGVKLSLKLVSVGCGITRRNDMNQIRLQTRGKCYDSKQEINNPNEGALKHQMSFGYLSVWCWNSLVGNHLKLSFRGQERPLGSVLGPPCFRKCEMEVAAPSPSEEEGSPLSPAEQKSREAEVKCWMWSKLFCR